MTYLVQVQILLTLNAITYSLWYLNHLVPWEWYPPKLVSCQVRKYKIYLIFLGTFVGFGYNIWGTGHLQRYASKNRMNDLSRLEKILWLLEDKQLSQTRKEMDMYLYSSFFPLKMKSRHWQPHFLDYWTDGFICYCWRVFSGSHW